jgi:type IV pilus assembly protein PilM
MSRKSIVGLDFGKGVARAIEISDPKGPRPVVLRHAELPLPADAILAGEVRDPRAVADVLRALWVQGGFKTKKVVLGIGNSRVLVRDLTIPKMPVSRIREALPYQVQDSLPVPVGDALLDFYPASEGVADGLGVIHGLLVAGMRSVIETNVKALELAGLQAVSVDLIPFALSRLLLPAEDTGHTALVHIGASTTIVTFVAAGIPQFVRIIPTGGDDITKALMTRVELEERDAEQAKRDVGLDRGAAADRLTGEVISEATAELLGGLRSTFAFYGNTRSATPVGRVLVSGGGSRLRGFAPALADALRLPVESADAAARIGLGEGVDAARFTALSGDLTVALGLAVGSAA